MEMPNKIYVKWIPDGEFFLAEISPFEGSTEYEKVKTPKGTPMARKFSLVKELIDAAYMQWSPGSLPDSLDNPSKIP